MSTSITVAEVNEYRDRVHHLAQQKNSRLRNAVDVESISGKRTFFEQLGSTEVRERTTRHADTPLMNIVHFRRALSARDFEWGELIDDVDRLRILISPDGEYTMAAAMAFGRKIDDIIIEAFDGTAYTGEDGTTATVFDTNYDVPVNYTDDADTDTGLTVGKLRRAKELLDVAENYEDDQRYFACAGHQLHEMLTKTEVTSQDYAAVKALVQGELDTFLGFKFIRTQRLGTDSNGYRKCMAWIKSGIKLGIQKEPFSKVGERPDKSYSTGVLYKGSFGAVRMEETKVVRVYCSES